MKRHLHRPVSVRLSDAQVDEAGHRQTHVEPVAEAEIVDELEHVLHTQEDQTHYPLHEKSLIILSGREFIYLCVPALYLGVR